MQGIDDEAHEGVGLSKSHWKTHSILRRKRERQRGFGVGGDDKLGVPRVRPELVGGVGSGAVLGCRGGGGRGPKPAAVEEAKVVAGLKTMMMVHQ
ncbi:hypothetical protein J5N97_010731 [Dioscorea zingiberensis]|uniref:Uncharacterized protein n=1 Tax=Dioscorea zingiberensis TaxID=325984 RepID=A0A9D5CZA1_9LILI|nr:hypothetical protein J5N97_010731 [Dioscorea zingiberensis]